MTDIDRLAGRWEEAVRRMADGREWEIGIFSVQRGGQGGRRRRRKCSHPCAIISEGGMVVCRVCGARGRVKDSGER